MIHPAGDLDVTQASADYRRRTHSQPPYIYASHIQSFYVSMAYSLCQKQCRLHCAIHLARAYCNSLWFVFVFSACVISLSCILCLRYPGEQIRCLDFSNNEFSKTFRCVSFCYRNLNECEVFRFYLLCFAIIFGVLEKWWENSNRYLIDLIHSICVSQSNLTSTKWQINLHQPFDLAHARKIFSK